MPKKLKTKHVGKINDFFFAVKLSYVSSSFGYKTGYIASKN